MAGNRTAKIYCGDKTNLPRTYNRFGSRYECLQCGYGAATAKYKWEPASTEPRWPDRRPGCLRSARNRHGNVRGNQFTQHRRAHTSSSNMSPSLRQELDSKFPWYCPHKKYIIPILIWFLLCALVFLVLYKKRPQIVTETDVNGKQQINWPKFAGIYSLMVLLITIVVIFGRSLL